MPHRAEVALAGVITVLVLTADLRGAIGFSSSGVLLYYFVANLAGFTQDPAHRRSVVRIHSARASLGCTSAQ